jgi:hypothetical protein
MGFPQLIPFGGSGGGGGGGGGTVNVGNCLFVDVVNGNDDSGRTGNLTQPYLTIATAISAAESGQTVFVYPGTYAGQITLADGVNLHFEEGVIITYIGDGPTITDAGQPVTCNISGKGSLQNAGPGTTMAAVILIASDSSTVYIDCHEIIMTSPGTNTGTVYTVNGINVGTAANGPGGSGAVHYIVAGIFSGNGLLQIACDHIVCTGCSAIVRTGNGKFFITVGDECMSSGTGVSTIVIGTGTTGDSSQREQPGWLTCKRIISDPSERVLSVEGNSFGMVMYLNADRIAGCVEDPAIFLGPFNVGGEIVLYVNWSFWTPIYNHDGSFATTTRDLCVLKSIGSFYGFDGTDIAAENVRLFDLAGGTSSVNSFIRVGRAYGLTSMVEEIRVAAGTNITMHIDRLECNNTNGSGQNGIVYNGGNLILSGMIEWLQGDTSANPIKLTASGLTLKNVKFLNHGQVPVAGAFSINTSNVDSDVPMPANGTTEVVPSVELMAAKLSTVSTPATGATITGSSYCFEELLEIEPSGTLATLTILLETADLLPFGAVKQISTSQILTSATVNPSTTGGNINGTAISASTLAANTSVAYKKTASKTWRRLY